MPQRGRRLDSGQMNVVESEHDRLFRPDFRFVRLDSARRATSALQFRGLPEPDIGGGATRVLVNFLRRRTEGTE